MLGLKPSDRLGYASCYGKTVRGPGSRSGDVENWTDSC